MSFTGARRLKSLQSCLNKGIWKENFFVNENVFSNYDVFSYATFFITIPLFKGLNKQSAKQVQQSKNICQIPYLKKCPPQILSDAMVFQTLGRENNVRKITPKVILFHTSASPICLPGDFALAPQRAMAGARSHNGIPWVRVDTPAQTLCVMEATQAWR